jgi:hypothetical protein
MRRPPLEILLVGALGLVLTGLLLLGPSAEERGGPTLDLGGPVPCDPALRDVGGVEAPADADVASVATVVERLRDLRFEEVPEPTYLPPERLAERVSDLFEYPEEQADLDARALALLGAIPEGYDLRAELMALAEEQVIGLYDPRTEELVVRADAGEDPGPEEVLTLAHELGHALADQTLGLPDLERLLEEDPEAAAATQALIEGDAMVITHLYASIGLRLTDHLSLLGRAAQPSGLEGVPPFIVRSMGFPYVEGAAFVCALYREGGWETVDEAYAEPPSTTAHILFPERYLAGEEAGSPREAADLPGRWDPADPQTLGAADLLFLLESPGGDPSRAVAGAEEGAAGWDGGTLQVWTSGEETALAVLLLQREGERDLCSTVAEWYPRTHPDPVEWTQRSPTVRVATHDGGAAALRCPEDAVRLGIGPDLATALRASA